MMIQAETVRRQHYSVRGYESLQNFDVFMWSHGRLADGVAN